MMILLNPILLNSLYLLLFLPYVYSVSFNFTDFQPNTPNITYKGDAFSSGGVIQLTKNQQDGPLTSSVGHATYSEPLQLWDSRTGRLSDFETHFSFVIRAVDPSIYGDGLAFFLAPFPSDVPANSTGGFLGLFSNQSIFSSSGNQIVAVEFDSFQNSWDPSPDHVGINVNSIVSARNVTWKSSIKNGAKANAWVSYNSSTKNLNVFLSYADNPVYGGNSTLSFMIDLREVLPEQVSFGFSASTGKWIEIHNILSWEFHSSLDMGKAEKNKNISLVVGLTVGTGLLCCALGLVLFVWWKKKKCARNKGEMAYEMSMDDEFERGTGPKRFKYGELARATGNFSEEKKLGEGGFGGVYKGFLGEMSMSVAVKRVSRGSKQGKKEYVSEVKIISRLRHKNLVQLIGWCHDQGELLLVYELMPNGSLDFHLFGTKSTLTWEVRRKIALGLASGLLYLHEEWEQCVVHRDIKSSNVMLDSNFTARLGDFGLARLVDHELGSQTTVLAGTMGYLAPECVTTGKASKESDVYSFGIVCLEIACGRRPVELNKPNLVQWVWELYGTGNLVEAVDQRLGTDYDKQQVESLMIVGLWCAHPDHNLRPSIKQVINVLNFDSRLPTLPSNLPRPIYFAPPMHMCKFLYESSECLTDSQRDHSQCSGSSSCSNYSSKIDKSSPSYSPSKSLLDSYKAGR